MDELLSLTIEPAESGSVVKLAGELDLSTTPILRDRLATLAGDVVVDLTDVSFLDSRAIALLVAEHRRRVDAGAHLVVKGSSSRALRTFAVTGVDQVLDLDGDSPTR